MQSIAYLPGSDGVNNASMATIQNTRSIGATTNIVNTVSGFPDKFYGSMGTPHTFTDPQTGETITVISEATARDFAGHLDGSNIEIDEFAPGQTDIGSEVGDIIIVRPVTEWANNLRNILSESMNDDGSLKAVVDNPGWTSLTYAPDTVTYLGNRSYQCVFNDVDLTNVLSNGMRLRTTRTVNAPTQCTSLNGTNQYYSKSSPAGMTFTDDFVVSAWVKLSSYAQGTIAARFNGTSGWWLQVKSTGQIELDGFNAGVGNVSYVTSYQSIPLNKWVHITAQLDMSAFTATTTTSYVMIDGVDVPCSVARAGTNPTALVQAGDLQIGAYNGATVPFPGKIAQAAVFNAKVTQATMRTYISQGLAGTETSLISAYSFNNSINDLNTTNANNLTANGSAVATNADSPFTQDDTGTPSGTNDFAIVTKKAFSTNTTLTVQVPEGCTIPTSGGVSAVVYSSNKVPYGFPSQKDKWRIAALYRASASTTGTAGTYSHITGAPQLTLGAGDFEVGYNVTARALITSGGSFIAAAAGLSTATSGTPTLPRTIKLAQTDYSSVPSNPVGVSAPMAASDGVSPATQTPYYLLFKPETNGSLSSGQQGFFAFYGNTNEIYAEPAGL